MKKALLLCSVFATYLLSGCGATPPAEDPAKILQTALYNLVNATSFRYEVVIDSKSVTNSDDGSKSSLEVDLSGAFSGGTDGNDRGSELNVVAKASAKDGDYRFDFAMKDLGDFLYVKLLDVPTIPDVSTELMATVVDKWWQIDMKEAGGTGFSMPSADGLGVSYDKLSKEGKAGRDLIQTSNFFKNIEFQGEEDVKGEVAYKYSVAIDTAGIEKYSASLVEITGGEMTPENKDALRKLMVGFEKFTGDVYVYKSTLDFAKIEGTVDASVASENLSGDSGLAITFYDVNKPFAVKAPVDYEKFNLAQFIGAYLMMNGGAGTDTGVDTVE